MRPRLGRRSPALGIADEGVAHLHRIGRPRVLGDDRVREESDVRELIKLRAIYELLESISDRCEDVANLIEGVVLENS